MKGRAGPISRSLLAVDRAIYRIHKRTRVLYHVNPVNATAEKRIFLAHARRGQDYRPRFRYKPLDFDPHLEIEALTALLPRCGGGDLGTLYARKIDEVATVLLLLASIGRPQAFLGYSISLYGTASGGQGLSGVDPLDVAAIWLSAPRRQERRSIPADGTGPSDRSAARMLGDEIARYGFDARVQVRGHLSANAAAGERSVAIRRGARYSLREVQRLKAHEVGFHILTTYNAKAHPIRILEIGTPGYLVAQEGGAIWAEEEARALTNYRLAVLGARTVGIHMATSGAQFPEVFRTMHEVHGFDAEDAWYICERVFRGGVFTKDAIYQRGFAMVRSQMRSGNLDPMVFVNGKMSLESAPLVARLMAEGVLPRPRYIPRFLRNREWRETWRTLWKSDRLFAVKEAVGNQG